MTARLTERPEISLRLQHHSPVSIRVAVTTKLLAAVSLLPTAVTAYPPGRAGTPDAIFTMKLGNLSANGLAEGLQF